MGVGENSFKKYMILIYMYNNIKRKQDYIFFLTTSLHIENIAMDTEYPNISAHGSTPYTDEPCTESENHAIHGAKRTGVSSCVVHVRACPRHVT